MSDCGRSCAQGRAASYLVFSSGFVVVVCVSAQVSFISMCLPDGFILGFVWIHASATRLVHVFTHLIRCTCIVRLRYSLEGSCMCGCVCVREVTIFV